MSHSALVVNCISSLAKSPEQCCKAHLSITYFDPVARNSLPNNIKNAPTFNIFKPVIKPFLRVRQDAT